MPFSASQVSQLNNEQIRYILIAMNVFLMLKALLVFTKAGDVLILTERLCTDIERRFPDIGQYK